MVWVRRVLTSLLRGIVGVVGAVVALAATVRSHGERMGRDEADGA